MNDQITLIEHDEIITVSSRDVAERFGKQHKDVLEAIRNLIDQNSAVKNMFIESAYKNTRGRYYEEYLMDRDGFSLLIMGFTGKKALAWKIKYLEAFNAMEERLKQRTYLSDEDRFKLQLFEQRPNRDPATRARYFADEYEKRCVSKIINIESHR